MSKHTPAPWLIAPEDKTFVYALGPGETNRFHAHLQAAGPERVSREELVANARLIATAPELLAALEDAEAILAQLYNQDYAVDVELKAARAAIAKATGDA